MNVLVVDDNEELLDLLQRSLMRADYRVLSARDVAEARSVLDGQRVDLMVLDLGLPDGSGLELCRALRASGSALPILVLTAQTSVGARVGSLDACADDHLGKPFAVAELQARVRALLRRTTLASSPLEFGQVSLDFRARVAKLGGKAAAVTGREWEILELLAARRGSVVTRAELQQLVWPDAESSAEASLEVLVSRLRRKLGPNVVRTVRGEGYALGEE
jgi:DNA-binding response OmpR family regulator